MNQKRLVTLTICWILAVVSGLPLLLLAGNESGTNAKAEQHFEKANELLNQKQYEPAIVELEEVINISPNSRIAQDAQYWMGQSHFMAGQYDDAEVAFARLMDLYPGTAIVPATKLMVERVKETKEEKELVEAVEEGDVVQLKLLVSKGIDVNAKVKVKVDADDNIKEGWTLLSLAAWHGHADIAALLINKGADVNARIQYGITPLWYAVDQRHLDVIELLISRGADIESPTAWGTSALIRSAGRGHLDVVELLISKGADIQAKNDWDQTPLQRAAWSGHIDIVKLLISKGANIETRDWKARTPLQLAVRGGHQEVAKLLLDKGAYVDSGDVVSATPLVGAIYTGNEDMIELLLARGAAPWRRWLGVGYVGVAMHAASNGGKDMVRFLIDKGFDYSPVHVAAFFGDLDAVKSYLAGGGNIDAMGPSFLSLLACATMGGQAEVVRFLIDEGANINLQFACGATALHLAMMSGGHAGRPEIARMLLDKRADVTLCDYLGRTALFCAAAESVNKDIVEMLLSRGADVNAKCGRMGDLFCTPLHAACESGNAAVAELLIAHGADVNAKTKNGETPMSLAKKRGHEKIVELLRKHGAKE